MKMHKAQWYLLANRSKCEIFFDGPEKKFSRIAGYSNPDGAKKESELDGGKPGRSFSSASGSGLRHSLQPRSNRHEHVAQKFAAKIADYLDRSRNEKKLTDLVVVAEPHFLGLLRSEMSTGLRRIISHEIAHSYQGNGRMLKKKIYDAINK